MHELAGIKCLQIIHLLTEPDKLHRQIHFLADGYDNTAFGGAVQFGEHESGYTAFFTKQLGLA
ncbi:hypothetical protein D3C74_502440 [compost metagenome]